MRRSGIPTGELSAAAMFTALTAVLTQVSIPLPFSPIPITLSTAAVYVSGMLLRPRCALLSQICYVLLGAVGAPVFSHFQGGFQVLLGPTGGYLFAYPLAAWLMARILGRPAVGRDALTPGLYVRGALALALGTAAIYGGGVTWMCLTAGMTLGETAAVALYPFLPLDLLKQALCLAGTLPVRKRLHTLGLLT